MRAASAPSSFPGPDDPRDRENPTSGVRLPRCRRRSAPPYLGSMTTQTATPPRATAAKPPLRIFLTILHLAGIGVIGGFIFATLSGTARHRPRSALRRRYRGCAPRRPRLRAVRRRLVRGRPRRRTVSGRRSHRCGCGHGIVPVSSAGCARSDGRRSTAGCGGRSRTSRSPRSSAGSCCAWRGASCGRSIDLLRSPRRSPTPSSARSEAGASPSRGRRSSASSGSPPPLAGMIGLALLHRVLALSIVVRSREAELTERVRTSTAQREGAVRAADVERTRIERDLHDGVQPRLVSVGHDARARPAEDRS